MLKDPPAGKEKIAAIIPALNEEKTIAKTLSAIRELKSCPYELIVSDGKSTDKTVSIAKQYADHVVEYKDTARQTIGQGRNLGAGVARGDYYLFVDADVTIPNINTFLPRALTAFRKNPHLVGLTVSLKVFPNEATLPDRFFFHMADTIYYIFNNILHLGGASGEFQMVRADAFKKLGGYSKTLVVGEDNEFFGRLAKLGRTRIEMGMSVFHTGRRAHTLGWFKVFGLWMGNAFFNRFFKRSLSSEWKVVR